MRFFVCERWTWEKKYILAKSLMMIFTLAPYLFVFQTYHYRSFQIPGKCIYGIYIHIYVFIYTCIYMDVRVLNACKSLAT